MPLYRVTLVRSFVVEIKASNPAIAREMSELYVGYSDNSQPEDQEKFGFLIEDIEMIQNDAIEAEDIEEV